MASMARQPRDILLESDAEYQRLAEQHSKYEAELHRISTSSYLSSEDLLEEIRLKKLKLHIKDEMELLAARIHHTRAQRTQ
ncbi:MAG TPA: YdcH family protein [Candidatus Dormibacteraeota bacterium]|nr:YdcH family protein [Candidatus Dormibacteraeota bacterium]